MNPTLPAVISFGELMLRLDAPTGQRLSQSSVLLRNYGGAEANVSVLLAQLGVPVSFVTALPANPIGEGAVQELKSLGVHTEAILLQGDRIGIYYHEPGAGIRTSRIYYDRAHSAFSNIGPGTIPWQELFKGRQWLHWSGITPALGNLSAELCREALDLARAQGIQISVDLNYRSTLWKYGKPPAAVMPSLLSGVNVLNGDLDALQLYLGITTYKTTPVEDQFQEAAAKTMQLLPHLKVVTMSFRGTTGQGHLTYKGALYTQGKSYFTENYVIPQITDRIGTGDAFMAGILYGILKKMPWDDVLAFGTASSVLKHSIEGDFAILNESEILEFTKTGLSYRVNR